MRGEMRALCAFLLLVFTVEATTGQAPGDEDDICLSMRDFVNEEVLMSSFNYRNLLINRAPWIVVDNDDNNDNVGMFASLTTWTEAGSTCRRTVGACGFREGAQNNWLITQYINNTMRQAVIYLRVRYAINSQCTGGCLTTLDTYVLLTNTSNQSFTGNLNDIFGNQPVAALTDTVRDAQAIITRVLPITTNRSTTGLYVAFRDLGTCIILSEATVFYPVCDAVSLNIGASFSEMGLPGVTASGACFANMAVSINPLVNSFNATCILTSELIPSQLTDLLFTNWTDDGNALQPCMCLPGYEFIDRTALVQCRACEAFYFKSTLSNTEMCKECPPFSNTSEMATAVCPCDDGYFRPIDGSEDAMACTRPPSAPQNITVSGVTNTSVCIMWEAPEDDGNRTDLFYSISHNVTGDIFNATSTNIMLTGLIPFVSYELRVTADNGVSSQDDDNIDMRTVTISIMTEGGVGGLIDGSSIHNFNGERLTWNPPEFPQGMIIRYEVLVNGTDVFTTTETEIDINSLGLEPGVYTIQVRAVTSIGPGNYSEPFRLSVTRQPDTSSSSNDSAFIFIGGAAGGIILLIMINLVFCAIIQCKRKLHKRRQHLYDQVSYRRTTDSTGGNIKTTHANLVAHNSKLNDENTYNVIIQSQYDPNYDYIDQDPTNAYTELDNKYDIIDQPQYDGPTVDQDPTNARTKLTGEDKYGVINQPQCDYPNFDTIDQDSTAAHVKLTGENKYGVINQPQCNDYSFGTVDQDSATAHTDEDKYGVVNQPQCNDPNFDTNDQDSTTTRANLPSEVKYAVINQPQCDNPCFYTIGQDSTASYVKLTGEDKYGVINQPQYDYPNFDTIDQDSTAAHVKLTGEDKYGVINQPQCEDCDFDTVDQDFATAHPKLTGENKYGVINQPLCDDHNFDTIDKGPTAAHAKLNSEDKFGVIDQPQCDNPTIDHNFTTKSLPLTNKVGSTDRGKYDIINESWLDDLM